MAKRNAATCGQKKNFTLEVYITYHRTKNRRKSRGRLLEVTPPSVGDGRSVVSKDLNRACGSAQREASPGRKGSALVRVGTVLYGYNTYCTIDKWFLPPER